MCRNLFATPTPYSPPGGEYFLGGERVLRFFSMLLILLHAPVRQCRWRIPANSTTRHFATLLKGVAVANASVTRSLKAGKG